jgi:hypothetical protein
MAEAQTPGGVSGGARCALHFGQPFTSVCKRCGTYMCQVCTEGGKFPVCPGCRARTGHGSFVLRRESLRWGELLRFSWGVYLKNWLVLTGAAFVALFGVFILQGASFALQGLLVDQMALMLTLQAALVIPQILLQGLLTLGMLSLAVHAARGEPVRLGMLVTPWRKLPGFALQVLAIVAANLPVMALLTVPAFALTFLWGPDPSMAVFGASLLCLPLGLFAFLYLGLGVAFSSLELVAQPEMDGLNGLRNAWSIARSERLAIFLGLLICGGLVWSGLVVCVAPVFPAYALACVIFASLYLTLRNGADSLVSSPVAPRAHAER